MLTFGTRAMGNNRRSSKGQGKGEVLKEKRPRERSGEGRDELQAQKKQKVELPPVDVTVGFELGEQVRHLVRCGSPPQRTDRP